MKSRSINTGYKRLGAVMGALAAIVSAIMISSDNARPPLWIFISIPAIFFVVHFVTFVGIGWTRANIGNPDEIYAKGAKAVAVFSPVSLIAFIIFCTFVMIMRGAGFNLSTLRAAVSILFMLPGPVFLVVVVVLAIVYVIDGFRREKVEE